MRGRRGSHGGPGQTNRQSATTARGRYGERHPPGHENPNQQKHSRTTARTAPSTRNRPPGQPTRPRTTRRKLRNPEEPHLPRTLPPAVKSKCRVSLSRGSVRFERGGPHTVSSGREMGLRVAPHGKEASSDGSPRQIRPWGPPPDEPRRKPAVTVRHDRPAPEAHLHQKAWERSLGGPPEARSISPPPPPGAPRSVLNRCRGRLEDRLRTPGQILRPD